jgi:amino acid adenylation domain-containing protein
MSYLSSHQLLHVRVAKIAHEQPNKKCLCIHDGSSQPRWFTYGDISYESRRIYETLIGCGFGEGSYVGVFIPRGLHLVASLFAIHALGGTYVPLDPSLPLERHVRCLRLGFVSGILTVPEVQRTAEEMCMAASDDEKRPTLPCVVAEVDDRSFNVNTMGERRMIECDWGSRTDVSSPAYVIFTSGTTGVPKAVLYPHIGLLCAIQTHLEILRVDSECDVFELSYSIGFDVHMHSVLCALVSGARLVVCKPHGHLDPQYWVDMVSQHGVSIVHTLPTLASMYAGEMKRRGQRCESIREWCCMGENFPCSLASALYQVCPNISTRGCINGYGPSETNVVTHAFVTPGNDRGIRIGRADPHVQCLIVDQHGGVISEVDVAGELVVSGPLVALGYIGDEKSTREKFIENPANVQREDEMYDYYKRCYRTGDLVSRMADGELEIHGRIDRQVKIRGVRIELAEVENILVGCQGVTGAAADVRVVHGEKVLVGWVTPEAIDVNLLFAACSENLIKAAIPACIIPLHQFPVSGTGKVDVESLTLPHDAPDQGDNPLSIDSMDTNVEKVVLKAWMDSLDVSIRDSSDFFSLGGNSLKAMAMCGAVQDGLGISLPLPITLVYENRSYRKFTHAVDILSHEDMQGREGMSTQLWPDSKRPLSMFQQQMWSVASLVDEQHAAAYNIGICFRIQGELDSKRLEKAFQDVVDRHDVLKTLVVVQQGTVIGKLSHQTVLVNEIQVSDCDIEHQLMIELNTWFDLESDLPIRVSLVSQQGEDARYLTIVLHHAVSDAWSLSVLCDEVSQLYRGDASLEPLQFQYADYVAWMRDQGLSGLDQKYWVEELCDAPEQLNFPLDFPRPHSNTLAGKTIKLDFLPDSKVSTLRDVSADHGVTLTSLFLASLQILLSRWANSSDIVVGVPTAIRSSASLQKLIGCLINPLPIRGRVNSDESFDIFLQMIQKKLLAAVSHCSLSLQEIINACKIRGDTSFNPLYQVIFQVHEEQLPVLNFGSDVACEEFEFPFPEISQVDFSVEIHIHPGKQNYICVEYSTEILNQYKIEQFIESYIALLEDLCESGLDRKIKEITYLSSGQVSILDSFSRGPCCNDYHKKPLLHLSFYQQALKSGKATCVKFEGVQYSYADVLYLTSKLMNQILGMHPAGVHKKCIAVYTSRSIDLVISMLAIFFLGGVYLPLESSLPVGRLCEYLLDSEAQLVVISGRVDAERVQSFKEKIKLGTIVVDTSQVDGLSSQFKPQEFEQKFAQDIGQDDVGCILFTSGSTGKPKGVILQHKGLVDVVWGSYIDMYGMTSDDVVILATSPAFDPHLANILAPLVCGASLSIVPPGLETDAFAVSNICIVDSVTFMDQVPSLVEIYAPEFVKNKGEIKLRILLFGGEPLPRTTAALLQQVPTLKDGIFNTYGPAEFTVVATCCRMLPGVPKAPLGTPDPNVRAYVVNPLMHDELQPVGVIGELLLSGPRISLGYINNDKETASRFVANPFIEPHWDQTNPFGYNVAYRTGDLVSWDSNGELHFHGRSDGQIKVNGVRIELDEVKFALSSCAGVTSAFALVLGMDGNKSLIGFVTPESVQAEDVIEFCSNHLIPAAVPSHIIPMQSFPLTATGKVDAKGLEEIGASHITASMGSSDAEWFVPAKTSTEVNVAELMRGVLGCRDEISALANFFQLGGNSLKAGVLSSKMRSHFNIPHLPATIVYHNKNVKCISAAIDALMSSEPSLLGLEASTFDEKRIEADKEISSTLGQVVSQTKLPFWLYLIIQYVMLSITMIMVPVIWGAMLVGVLELRKVISSWWLILIWPSMQVAAVFGYALLLICLKWILVWKLKPAVYPIYGFVYARWVTMRALQETASTTFFPAIRRTPILSFLIKALGSNIKSPSSVVLDSIDLKDFDLLTIGEGACIYSDASVTGAFVAPASYLGKRPVLVLSKVDIGEHCHIGHSSVVSPGSRIPARHNLKPHASRAHPGDAPRNGPLSDYPQFIAEERFGPVSSLFGGITNHFLESLADVPIVALCLFIIYRIVGDTILDSASGTTIAWRFVVFSALFTGLHGWLDPSLGLFLHLILVFAWKWLFVGRLLPGVNITRNYYSLFTYSVFRRMIESPKWQKIQILLTGTNLMAKVYRGLGAKVGEHVFIGGLSIVEFDALEVGTLACSGSDSWAFAANDDGIVEKITIKEEATIGNSSVLYPGCDIGNRSVVGNDTAICKGRALGDHVRAQGGLDYSVLSREDDVSQIENGIGLPFIVSKSESRVDATKLPWWHNGATVLALLILGPVAPVLLWLPLAAVASALKNQYWWLIPIAYVVMVAVGSLLAVMYLRILLECSGVKKRWEQGQVSVFHIPSLIIHTYFDIASASMDVFQGTPFAALIYRILGFKVGKGAILLGPQPLESSLISIGDGTVVESGASIDGHYMEYQKFIYHKVAIGDNCWIQEGARIMPFTEMKDSSRVMPGSMVLPGDTLDENSIWCGIPAEPIGKRQESAKKNRKSSRILTRSSRISRSDKTKNTGFLDLMASEKIQNSWYS